MNRINKMFLLGCSVVGLSLPFSAEAYIYFLPDYNSEQVTYVGHTSSLQEECKNNGYTITSCPEGSTPSGSCPWASGYYRECISSAEQCTKEGYEQSCPDGKVPDVSQYCSYDHSYIKCVCDECEGYDYTYIQATTGGYVVDGSGCQSCEELRYKRKENPCDGYDYDSSNCGVTSCGTLSGNTCQSGTTVKYAECKSCPAPSCSSTEWNLDSYWCNGALRCWLPEK